MSEPARAPTKHMSRRVAALGSAAFFVAAPGVVGGLLPWWLTHWQTRTSYWMPLRIAGAALLLCGVVTLAIAFVDFVTHGIGTPAPVAPTRHLVVTGPYRHVRNPMYLAVLATIVGQAIALGQPVLLAYAFAVALAVVAFVLGYEEPTLRHQFGDQYDSYRHAVARWRPRIRPWTPPPGPPAPPDHAERAA
jgi:protein-S-isoprenylcysteine O-methyltransferase Ste14